MLYLVCVQLHATCRGSALAYDIINSYKNLIIFSFRKDLTLKFYVSLSTLKLEYC